MSANLSLLDGNFSTKVNSLITNCVARGIEMRPYVSIRTPVEQAIAWRQSRSIEEVTAKIKEFQNSAAPFLAHCLESVGPQHGDHVTNAPPGLSWHQWGEAVDCFWLVNNKAEWSSQKTINGLNGYRVYAEEAAKLDLDPGGLWRTLKDWPHVQFQKAASPLKLYSLADISKRMESNFG
ncbi:MAG: M15 family peptidase [Methylobacter sp.]|nr:MAG: M15 family peptidase [Methylobacter sp.]